jgi:hypothetical protein
MLSKLVKLGQNAGGNLPEWEIGVRVRIDGSGLGGFKAQIAAARKRRAAPLPPGPKPKSTKNKPQLILLWSQFFRKFIPLARERELFAAGAFQLLRNAWIGG